MIIVKIPIKASRNMYSAARSNCCSFFDVLVRIETNDKTEEAIKIKATMEVNSSISEFSVLSVKCSEVIINKQNPSKLDAVPKICCDVLFAIFIEFSDYKIKQIYNVIKNEREKCL